MNNSTGKPALRRRRKAGVIGLGIIGSRVVQVLRRKNFEVYVWNRSPRPQPNFMGSPAEVARAAEVLQIFVSDHEAFSQVLEKLLPELGPRHIVLNHATIAPEYATGAAELVQQKGAAFLDAPFTGSKEAAARGELVYYIGGDEAALEECRACLEASSRAILLLGKAGDASILKIATNLITGSTVQLLAEALALVRRHDIDPQKLLEALESNAVRSKLCDMKLPSMIAGDFQPHFSLRNMFKDLRYALHLALRKKIPLPLTSATARLMHHAIRDGWGEEDFSVLIRRYGEESAAQEQPVKSGSVKKVEEFLQKAREPGSVPSPLITTPEAPEEILQEEQPQTGEEEELPPAAVPPEQEETRQIDADEADQVDADEAEPSSEEDFPQRNSIEIQPISRSRNSDHRRPDLPHRTSRLRLPDPPSV